MLIDKYLPEYHFSEKHTTEVNATNELILKTIIDLQPKDISVLFRLLFFIRSIPPRILGKSYLGFRSDRPLMKQMEEKGFEVLETSNDEIVIGIINQNGKVKRSGASPSPRPAPPAAGRTRP